MADSMQRCLPSILLFLLLTFLPERILGTVPEPADDQFGAVLFTTEGEPGVELAVHWTGDPTVRLSAWIALDGVAEELVLDRVPLDRGIQLFPLEVPSRPRYEAASLPVRFRLSRAGQAPRDWEDRVEWLGPSQLTANEGSAENVGSQCAWADGFFWDGGVSGQGFLGTLLALAVYDSDGGPVLVAGGDFTTAGGVAANRIAQWDGTSWSPLGTGLDDGVDALAVYDDGVAGPVLVAAGRFTTAGGLAANRIAQWDGSSWSPLGSGIDGTVWALASYDDGSVPVLVAAGSFTMAGGVAAANIAQWNGMGWSPLGAGLDQQTIALASYDGGSEPVLVAGGWFTTAGGTPANYVAQWNGSTWSPLGSGTDSLVDSLGVYDSGSSSVLIVTGGFDTAGGVASARIAQWDGTSWGALSSAAEGRPWATTTWDPGSGPVLVAGGAINTIDGVSANRIAQWDGIQWAPLGSGIEQGAVYAVAVFDDGSGPALVVGGDFEIAGGIPSSRIAMLSCDIPNLDIPDQVPATSGQPVTVPVVLSTDGASLGGTSFSVDYDESCLSLDPTDEEPIGMPDGVPDSVTYHGPAGYDFFVTLDTSDTDGELDIALFDSAPGNPMLDGTLVTLDLDVVCSPAGDQEAPVRFSSDPDPTFGDLDALDVPGTWSDGSVVIYGGLRGDCNSSGDLGVADLIAGELEIFDDDGNFWADVPGSTFVGLPVGCDSNADTLVDAGDLSCTYRLLFGLVCDPADRGAGLEPPILELGPWEVPLDGDRAVSRLSLRSAGWQANSLVVSLDLDTDRFTFDPADDDGDGIPDAIRLPGFVPSRVAASWDPTDIDGELDLVLSHPDVDPTVFFPDLLEVEVEVRAAKGSGGFVLQPFRFSPDPSPSLGDVLGRGLVPVASIPETGLFADGFESGDLGAWSSSQQ